MVLDPRKQTKKEEKEEMTTNPTLNGETVVEENSNVIPFPQKTSEPPKSEDWLSDLPVGTYFLSRKKTGGVNPMFGFPLLDFYAVVHKTDTGSVRLANIDNKFSIWVNSPVFSSHNRWVETLGRETVETNEPTEAQIEEKKETDG